MSIGEIISESFRYPLGDKENFKYPAIIFLLLGLGIAGIVTLFEFAMWFGGGSSSDFGAILWIFAILALFLYVIFALIAPGYLVSVTREGIDQTGLIPPLEIGANIVNSIKLAILGFIYMIIPSIFAVIFVVIISSVARSDAAPALAIIGLLILLIIYLLFAFLLVVAEMRFAKYDSLSEALSFGEVYEDLKDIGILKLLVVCIIMSILIEIIAGIGFIVALIPVIGGLIYGCLVLPFCALAYSYAMGLLYSDIA